jgi:transcriptional regulator with XRE-family HTH domain
MNDDYSTGVASTVCLDAAELKRIREGLQLTQLYVSKVVGVTTDTISRWENNRYPTIRRENAIKLAEALEVSLSDILLRAAEEPVASVVESKKNKHILWLILLALGLIALFVVLSSTGSPPPPSVAVTAKRILPGFAGPGSTIPVQVSLAHRTNNSGVILREYFPKGWKLVQASPPASSLDNVNGVARWIIKAGDSRERIVYLVQVDPDAKPDHESLFQGEIVASNQGNQSAVPVQGETSIVVASAHWADADGNGRIDDGEMLEASFTIEDMEGVHIDWDDLEQLWDAGSYMWDTAKGKFVPAQ